MKGTSFLLSTLERATQWAQASSLWITTVHTGCCANEVFNAFGNRYDMERLGAQMQVDPSLADLLIIFGAVNSKAAPEIRRVYEQMSEPRYVMAVGACACGGGPYEQLGYAVLPGVDQILPVDVYVSGCPPRPEAIMNGLITLQEKIRGID